MTIIARHWVPSAAVVPQERGPEFLAVVDGADWSEGVGFHRGFFSTFRVRAGKAVWFHFPLPTPVEIGGQPVSLAEVSLLWECLEGAKIGWMCLQHGGMDRIELTPGWCSRSPCQCRMTYPRNGAPITRSASVA
ncbi:hypothetical protein OKA06_09910 [Novosphingobium sp. MW5]|nr:hypothetical protein [Novosphingobium sp. MW5]